MSTHEEKSEEKKVEEENKEISDSDGDVKIEDLKRPFPEMVQISEQLRSSDPNSQLASTIKLRQLLAMDSSSKINLLINEVIKAGLVPILVSFLSQNNLPQLQFEACWAITNLCSGSESQVNVLLRHNVVPSLIQLLSNYNADTREQAVWALGNISGDSPRSRDYVLKCNILQPLFKLIEHRPNLQTLRVSVWCLSNLVRGKPVVDYLVIVKMIPLLSYLIYNSDNDVLADSLCSISYIAQGGVNRIQCIIESNIINRVVELLAHSNEKVQFFALRTIAIVVTGNDQQTQAVISRGALPILKNLLKHTKIKFRREVAWAISNICAGPQDQIQNVIECDILRDIISILNDYESGSKKEHEGIASALRVDSMYCVTNCLMRGTSRQAQNLVTFGAVKTICDALKSDDAGLIMVALDGIHALLERGKSFSKRSILEENVYAIFVEKCGGVDHLKNLYIFRVNDDVRKKVFRILSKYFTIPDVDEKERVKYFLVLLEGEIEKESKDILKIGIAGNSFQIQYLYCNKFLFG